MKKIIGLTCLIAVEEDEDKKVDLLVSLYTAEMNNNPDWVIGIGSKLLNHSD